MADITIPQEFEALPWGRLCSLEGWA